MKEEEQNKEEKPTIETVGDFFDSLPPLDIQPNLEDSKSKKEEEILFNYNV